jgi:Ricin-type beta-trefoil lectin domain
VVRSNSGGTLATLASGTVAAPGTGTWQHLALTFSGATITAAVNGTTVATVTDSTYGSGMVGFGVNGYQTDQFDNLSVTPAGSAGGSTGPITAGANSAKCADDNAQSTANGTKIQMWNCNGGANQQWHATSGTLVNPASGKCLDDPGSNTANGTQLVLWTCNGGSNQQPAFRVIRRA